MLNGVCQGAGLFAQLAGAWVPGVKVVADVATKLCVVGSFGSEVVRYAQEKYATKGESSEQASVGEQPRPVARKGTSLSVLAAAAVVTVGQMPVSAATQEPPKTTDHPIPVPDQETLAQIGQSDRYPLSGHYVQTQDINSDVSIGSDDQPFYGHYDGGCHTISGQGRCLFGKLAEHGVVSNLRMARAHVESNDKYSAVVACKMGEGSRMENLQIEHSSLLANKDGMGDMEAAIMTHAGVVTAHQQENSHIEQIGINNCSVTSTGEFGSVGMISGWAEGDIQQVTVNNGRVKADRYHARAGIGAGIVDGRIDRLTVLGSQVEAAALSSFAGIGGGVINYGGKLEKLTAVNSSVTTKADQSEAGIGAGKCNYDGLLAGTTAVGCNVTTSGDGANAGIGVGENRGEVLDTRAIDCSVNTTGMHADAAIGAGFFDGGKTEGITAVNSRVTTSGERSKGGVGAGAIDRYLALINHPSVVNMTNSVRGVNVTVNGELRNIGNVSQSFFDQLCDIADQRFIANDCRVVGQSSQGEWNCTATVLPFVSSSASTSEARPVATSLPISGASATANTALVNYSGAPTALTLVATAAQTGTTLSTGAIVGISVGVTAGALAIGALLAWRYYNRGPVYPDIVTMRALSDVEEESDYG